MEQWIELIGKAALVGVGATAVMDAWLILLRKLNIPTLNFALLGRWAGHAIHGRWFHAGIAKSPAVRNELAIGWAVHYLIGIGFAILHVLVFGIEWLANPKFAPAIITGIATVIAPLFIMQPAMGSGIASSKTAMPIRNSLKSLINHAVFGCGIYLTSLAIRWI